jgi:hypothetical protein
MMTTTFVRPAVIILALWLSVCGSGYAQSITPFDPLAGHWIGAGTIDLSNGAREAIRCRASYDVLEQQNKLMLNIRCASESYNFDLRGSPRYTAGKITGTWSESTRNAAGTIAGEADKDRFQVLAKGPAFSAKLMLQTRGDQRFVDIESQDIKSSVKGASIKLQRS